MNPATSPMIKASASFHSSVNIAYDFDNVKKIQDFIPTSEGIRFIDESIQSAQLSSNPHRSRILIGAYGKGKSSIVLEAISFLHNNPQNRKALDAAIERIQKKDPQAAESIRQYVKSGKRLLPVIINGNSSSLSQSFLYALHSTLKKNEFRNLMPETHFEAAARTIEKWEREFPDTFKRFNATASCKSNAFKNALRNFSPKHLQEFEELYPQLTAGSSFNPFEGFDIVDIYENVARKLAESKRYSGIYIVYDEFGKYLESSITHASIKDIKLLQDFAERADRSGKNQLHLVLICHKEIENYIDILPKQKVDGWKGVSERFRHIRLYNNYSEIYGLVEAAISKDKEKWKSFRKRHETAFKAVGAKWFGKQSLLFANDPASAQQAILYGSYPLHPVTTYILPRLSEKIAQNERTLFTFLCGNERNCLASLAKKTDFETESKDKKFPIFAPDILFDYFESQLQNEPYASEIKKHYIKASAILRELEHGSLEAKLVKTITLIDTVNQFERLRPDTDTLFAIYRDAGYDQGAIRQAVQNLAKAGAIYQNAHNGQIQLKASSGIHVEQLVRDTVEKRRRDVTPVQVLNEFNPYRYVYPTLYNVENRITRYFQFVFASPKDFSSQNACKNVRQKARENPYQADGFVFAIFEEEGRAPRQKFRKEFLEISREFPDSVFILSTSDGQFSESLRKLDAIATLQKNLQATGDASSPLAEECEMHYRDLYEVTRQVACSYLCPEINQAIYVNNGEEKRLYRKSDFTKLLSDICKSVFKNSPIINNEMLNKNALTGVAAKSRIKLVNAILASASGKLELEGTGQEISFMRSALVVPGILDKRSGQKLFCLAPKTDNGQNDEKFKNLFSTIQNFYAKAKKETSFSELIDLLVDPTNHIGLRRGVIPVYLAVALAEISKNAVIKKKDIEVPTSAETLCAIPESPEQFTVKIEKWNEERAEYVLSLEALFADFIQEDEKRENGYAYLANAILRWYRSLPKYAKQTRKAFFSKNGNRSFLPYALKFSSLLQQGGFGAQEALFEKIPQALGEHDCNSNSFDKLHQARQFFDSCKENLVAYLVHETAQAFSSQPSTQKSLKSLIGEFCKKLDRATADYVFENGAHKLLQLYRSASNDEIATIQDMAVLLTGLDIDDWSDETTSIYFSRLQELNATLLAYKDASKNKSANSRISPSGYTLQFLHKGEAHSKSFQKVECSVRAKSLEEEIWRTFEEMGQSVTEAEKRQVLVSLLEKMC